MRLLVLDVEGTLFETKVRLPGTTIRSTVWQGIAHELGPQAVREEVETHRRWHGGKYESYLDWMKDTINIHKRHGLTSALFENVISSAEYNPRVPATEAAIDRSLFEPVLISGGFRELAARAQIDLKINHAFAACEYFFSEDGALEAYNLLPCDFEGKIDFPSDAPGIRPARGGLGFCRRRAERHSDSQGGACLRGVCGAPRVEKHCGLLDR